MRNLLMVVGVAVLLMVGATVVLAKDEKVDPVVDTLVVMIDGVTRPVTVTFVLTGVLAVEVGPAPVTDTFAVTAQGWLDDLFMSLGDLQPNDTGSAEKINATLDEFLEATETVAYPARYTPFVRQFRFTIHTCRDWVNFHEQVTKDDQGMAFAIAPYLTLQSACRNRYQEAYVEMERITHAR